MRSSCLALLLLAAPAALAVTPEARAAQAEPRAATPPGAVQAAPSAPATAGLVGVPASPVLPGPAAAPAVVLTGPPPPVAAAAVVPARPATPPTPAVPTRELIEKLGAGDRAYLSGDFRTALFAYQDAVYLDPTSAVARVKVARAYLALGHRDQAEPQLKQALELDPGHAEARRLLDDLSRPAPPPAAAPVISGLAAPAALAAAAPPRAYRLTDGASAPPPPMSAPGAGVAAGQADASQATATLSAVAAAGAVLGDQQEASRHYRAAILLIGSRDFAGAIAELDQSLALNPQLGVARAARASALYGLGRYQDAASDYQAAMALVPQLATPVYGLAETYRRLGDPRAAELYLRYAESGASDVSPELRETARQRAAQLGAR